MATDLKAVEWQSLTKDERIALCRRLAEEAERDRSRWGGSKDDLASQWRMLAAEIALSN